MWTEAPRDEVSSTCVLRSGLACKLMLILPLAQHSMLWRKTSTEEGGIRSVKCLSESLTLRNRKKHGLWKEHAWNGQIQAHYLCLAGACLPLLSWGHSGNSWVCGPICRREGDGGGGYLWECVASGHLSEAECSFLLQQKSVLRLFLPGLCMVHSTGFSVFISLV